MNIVKELRRKKGIQQKELAIAIGVSCPTVSGWETGKKDPSGDRLKKLAEYFDVDELFVLGYGLEKQNTSSISETEQIVQYVLNKLGKSDDSPSSEESRIISSAVDKMPPQDREKALNLLKAVYSDYFRTEEKNA